MMDLDMDMRSRRAAGRADTANLLACGDTVAHGDVETFHVGKDGLPAIAVIDRDRIAPGRLAVEAGGGMDDHARAGGDDGCAPFGGNVGPVVEDRRPGRPGRRLP